MVGNNNRLNEPPNILDVSNLTEKDSSGFVVKCELFDIDSEKDKNLLTEMFLKCFVINVENGSIEIYIYVPGFATQLIIDKIKNELYGLNENMSDRDYRRKMKNKKWFEAKRNTYCNNPCCPNENTNQNLIRCSKCHKAWYCSQKCKNVDLFIHKKNCTQRVCMKCDISPSANISFKKCGRCGKVYYCSRECQKAHWPSHKTTCKKK